MTSKKSFIFLAFLFLLSNVNSQEKTKTLDSLLSKTYGELFQITDTVKDSVQKEYYARILLRKAALIDSSKVHWGKSAAYHFLANNRYLHEESLAYADSIILSMGNKIGKTYPGVAYLIKAEYYFTKKSYKKALENYLLLLSASRKANDSVLIFRAIQDISDLKRTLGKSDEIIEGLKESNRYIQKTKDSITDIEHLRNISLLALAYNDQKELDFASIYNKYGVKESIRLQNSLYYADFALNQGLTAYYNNQFTVAIDSFERYIPVIKNYPNSSKLLPERLALSLFYNGKSNLKLSLQNKAIDNFKGIDSLFRTDKSLLSITKESYQYLIDFYKNKGDLKNQLIYINQFLKVDSIIDADKLFLHNEIIKEYDVPNLKRAKQNIEQQLKEQKTREKYIIIGSSTFIIILLISLIIQYQKRKLYKKRFQEIISNTDQIKEQSINNKKNGKNDSRKINLQENIIQEILEKLTTFEKNQGFLSQNITLGTLSKKLKTNPNYLSKVINHYKKSSFTKYLGTLRVEYAIEQLKTNSTFRKYTIKAIAEEVGFNNVQAFAKAFQHSKGINPSYFLKELKKSIQLTDK